MIHGPLNVKFINFRSKVPYSSQKLSVTVNTTKELSGNMLSLAKKMHHYLSSICNTFF